MAHAATRWPSRGDRAADPRSLATGSRTTGSSAAPRPGRGSAMGRTRMTEHNPLPLLNRDYQMTNLPQSSVPTIAHGIRTYSPSAHGFFDEVATLFVNLASFSAAVESYHNAGMTQIPAWTGHALNLMGRVVHVTAPDHSLMHGVVRNQWPTLVTCTFVPQNVAAPTNSNGVVLQTDAIENMVVRMVGSAFMRYYEGRTQRLKAAYPQGPKSYPHIWRLAWHLRNAIAHGDRWKIDDHTMPLTEWHGVQVGPSDSGQKWFDIKRFIAGGDVLLLLEELDASGV